jgi:hypothetical protein
MTWLVACLGVLHVLVLAVPCLVCALALPRQQDLLVVREVALLTHATRVWCVALLGRGWGQFRLRSGPEGGQLSMAACLLGCALLAGAAALTCRCCCSLCVCCQHQPGCRTVLYTRL